jgi:hypothetical protein
MAWCPCHHRAGTTKKMNAIGPVTTANLHLKHYDLTHCNEDQAIGNNEDKQKGNIAQDQEQHTVAR